MLTNEIKVAFEAFGKDGNIISVNQITAGLINATYLIETDIKEKYILQKINSFVFKNPDGLMKNIVGVTKHLSEKIKGFALKTEDVLKLTIRLPAGGEDNVNPKILLDKYMEIIGDIAGFYEINRTGLFLADGTKFE